MDVLTEVLTRFTLLPPHPSPFLHSHNVPCPNELSLRTLVFFPEISNAQKPHPPSGCHHCFVSQILYIQSSRVSLLIPSWTIFCFHKWAASWQNQQNGMCDQQRLGWSGSLLSAWRKLGSLIIATHWVHSEDSDQTGWMPRLIWVFAGHTCHFVGFVMQQLKSFEPEYSKT